MPHTNRSLSVPKGNFINLRGCALVPIHAKFTALVGVRSNIFPDYYVFCPFFGKSYKKV